MLAIVQVALGWLAWSQARERSTVYVFTPMVDVVPGGAPLSAEEAGALKVRTQVDARDMQTAYARMGSTMSLGDLLRGVEALEAEGALGPEERERVRGILDRAKQDHASAVAVQREILDLEAAVAAEVRAVLAEIAPEERARVEARLR